MNNRISKLPTAAEARAESIAVILAHQNKVKDDAVTCLNTKIFKAREAASNAGVFEAEVVLQSYYFGKDLELYCETISSELRRLGYELTITECNNGSMNARTLSFSWPERA